MNNGVGCPFHKSGKIQTLAKKIHGIVDVEQLKKICRDRHVCPYV